MVVLLNHYTDDDVQVWICRDREAAEKLLKDNLNKGGIDLSKIAAIEGEELEILPDGSLTFKEA